MKKSLSIALLGLLLAVLTGPGRAGEPAEPKAIVDKAVKAVGGQEKWAKIKAMTWNGSGKFYGMGEGLPYTGTYAVQWPNQFRMEIQNVFAIVLDGDKGWIKAGGATKEMNKEDLAEQQEGQYASWVASLVPLNDNAFTLKSLGVVKVGDGDTNGIKVSKKGHRDVLLYFDAKTGLLVKSQSQVKSKEMEGKEVKQEAYYSDYKEIQGVQVPLKVVVKREGKVYVEEAMTEIKLLEKLDKNTFAEP